MNSEKRPCIPERDCRTEPVAPKLDDLLKSDWETLVIRHDKETGRYNWLTQSCKSEFVHRHETLRSADDGISHELDRM